MLPNEILTDILGHLSAFDLDAVRITDRHLKTFSTDDAFLSKAPLRLISRADVTRPFTLRAVSDGNVVEK